jgi:branched-chain amino acid transport system ATP-binding protein
MLEQVKSASVVGVPAMAADGLSAGYGNIPVVRDISIQVMPGEVVALLGANGAGKTTTLLSLAGELTPLGGRVLWNGKPLTGPLYKRAKMGLRLITEDRSVFMSLSVADNLRLAHRDYSPCLELFPELKPLLKRTVGLLSGGEQQMLSLARAVVGECKVLLADELSLGLAPKPVERLFAAVRMAAAQGAAVILVEQQLDRALKVADRAYTFRRGRVIMDGTIAEIAQRRDEVEASYLAMDDEEVE